MRQSPFLTAEWRDLVMLNYRVEPALLAPLAPAGTVVDQFAGNTYISLVGFRFERTRIRGLWIPFHSNFEEVNLRFYVKREREGAWRRGVVFVREIVPRWAVAQVARFSFYENYIALPMDHQVVRPAAAGGRISAEYGWRLGAARNSMRVECDGEPRYAEEGSLEQFITEHYWGYARRRDGRSLEYQVAHEPWRVWRAAQAKFQGDSEALYGAHFARHLWREPDSAFLAEGSPVAVYPGKLLD